VSRIRSVLGTWFTNQKPISCLLLSHLAFGPSAVRYWGGQVKVSVRRRNLGLKPTFQETTNSEIARKCFTYLHDGALAYGSVQLMEKDHKAIDTSHLQAFPLLSYAVLHWPEHARYSSGLAEDIFDLSIPFYAKESPIRKGLVNDVLDRERGWGAPKLLFAVTLGVSFWFSSVYLETPPEGLE
jgi:hypothetical protein